jgi:transposase-like protein
MDLTYRGTPRKRSLPKYITAEDKLMIAKLCIENEYRYSQTARKFDIPKSRVFRLVQQLETLGEELFMEKHKKVKPVGGIKNEVFDGIKTTDHERSF